MTRAEYLEYVQECCGFKPNIDAMENAMESCDFTLRDTPEVCEALRMAHARYCTEVEIILFPERVEEARKELAGVVMLSELQAGNKDEAARIAEEHGFCA